MVKPCLNCICTLKYYGIKIYYTDDKCQIIKVILIK